MIVLKQSTEPGQAAEVVKPGLPKAYKDIYRAVYEYHEAFTPPPVDREYWRTHVPGEDMPTAEEVEYFSRASDAMGKLAERFDNHPHAVALAIAVYDELARRYGEARAEAHAG